MATIATALTEARTLYTRLWQGKVTDGAAVAKELKALIAEFDLDAGRVGNNARASEKQLLAEIDQFVKDVPAKHESQIVYARRIYAGLDDTRFTPAILSVNQIRTTLADIGKDLSVLDATGSKDAKAIDAELNQVVATDELRRAGSLFAALGQSPMPRGYGHSAADTARYIRESLKQAGATPEAIGTTDDAINQLVSARELERARELAESVIRKDRAGYINPNGAREAACRIVAEQSFNIGQLASATTSAEQIEAALHCGKPPAARGAAPAR